MIEKTLIEGRSKKLFKALRRCYGGEGKVLKGSITIKLPLKRRIILLWNCALVTNRRRRRGRRQRRMSQAAKGIVYLVDRNDAGC